MIRQCYSNSIPSPCILSSVMNHSVYKLERTNGRMATLLTSPYGQTIVEASSSPYGIGRAPENQLVLSDAMVSSHHAQLRRQGQGYEIVDLGSSNGTFVNGQRLSPNAPYRLSSGDQIRVGSTTYTFEGGE